MTSLHAATIMLAYGAFGLGAVAAAMFLTQQHDLKFHKLRAVLSLLPPIQRLEIIAGRLVFAGFILFTVGLAAGRHLPRPAGRGLLAGPKGGLVHLYVGGLSGAARAARMRVPSSRGFAISFIAAFVILLLTFWGTNLLSPLHHP